MPNLNSIPSISFAVHAVFITDSKIRSRLSSDSKGTISDEKMDSFSMNLFFNDLIKALRPDLYESSPFLIAFSKEYRQKP